MLDSNFHNSINKQNEVSYPHPRFVRLRDGFRNRFRADSHGKLELLHRLERHRLSNGVANGDFLLQYGPRKTVRRPFSVIRDSCIRDSFRFYVFQWRFPKRLQRVLKLLHVISGNPLMARPWSASLAEVRVTCRALH